MRIRERTARRALGVLATAAVGAIVADAVYRAGPRERTDLPVYLAGSREVLAGRDPLLVESSRGWPYVYPPTVAVLLAPLTPLPLRVGAGLWCLTGLLVLGAGLRAWGRLLPLGSPPEPKAASSAGRACPDDPASPDGAVSGSAPDPAPGNEPDPAGETIRALAARLRANPWAWELGLPLVLVLLPALSALLRGQVGPLLLGCGLLAWADLRRGRDLRAGALLALCAAIKLTPLLVIAGLAAARRWRALAGATLGLVACLVLLPLPLLGPQKTVASLAHFGQHMILRPLSDPSDPDMTSLNTHVPRNQSLIALGVRRLEGAPRLLALGLLALSVPLTLLRAAWRLDLGAYALLWGLPLLIAPVAWHHHHVLAFFALALLSAQRSWVVAAFALTSLVHFVAPPLQPFGFLALGTLLALAAAADPRRATPPPEVRPT